MPPIIATLVYVIGIMGLLYLDRHDGPRISQALWIPAVWLFLTSSRGVSSWLGVTGGGSFYGRLDSTEAYVEGSPVDRAVFAVLMLLALLVLFKRADKVGLILRKNGLLIAYFLFCLFSVVWSDFPLVAFKRWTKTVLGDMPMILIILTETHPLIALKRLLTKLGFLLFPLSILFILYYPGLGRRLTNSWTQEPTGVATQKNGLGLICMIYGVFFLWMLVSIWREKVDRSRRRRIIAYGTIILMIVWLLRACNSTTSIVGFACSALVMWFAWRPARKPAYVHLLVLAVLGSATIAIFFNPAGDMVEALGKSTTLSGRTEIWKAVMSLHTNPVIGTGFESFWLGKRLDFMGTVFENLPINEAHNGYLELYLNLGWAGICFLAVLILTAYRRVMFRWRQNPQVASLFVGFLLCTLFNAFTENAFRIMTPSWILFLLVMLATSHSEMFRPLPQSSAAQAGDVGGIEEPAYALDTLAWG